MAKTSGRAGIELTTLDETKTALNDEASETEQDDEQTGKRVSRVSFQGVADDSDKMHPQLPEKSPFRRSSSSRLTFRGISMGISAFLSQHRTQHPFGPNSASVNKWETFLNKQWVRFVTVTLYVFVMILTAILAAIYYSVVWTPSPTRLLNLVNSSLSNETTVPSR
jgi:hypothetical protein